MGGFIEPNIHPVLVHFAFALSVSASLAYIVSALPLAGRFRDTLRPAADWMLAFGAVAILATVAAGFQAYYSVAHDGPSHAAMTTHRNWAVPTSLFILSLAGWRYATRKTAPRGIFIALMALGALSLSVTAWWGGNLVFKYGLGVQSLPAVTGDGHDHDHGDGGHSAPAASNATPDMKGAEHDAHDDQTVDGHHEETMRPKAHDNSDGHHATDVIDDIEVTEDGSPSSIVTRFGMALKAEDVDTLRSLVAPDVIIAEGGGTERSFDEYAGHHMASDMAFMRAVDSELKRRDLIEGTGLTTVISESQIHGNFNGKIVHAKMTETMVLRQTDTGWRIAHIHWSSAPITGEHEH